MKFSCISILQDKSVLTNILVFRIIPPPYQYILLMEIMLEPIAYRSYTSSSTSGTLAKIASYFARLPLFSPFLKIALSHQSRNFFSDRR